MFNISMPSLQKPASSSSSGGIFGDLFGSGTVGGGGSYSGGHGSYGGGHGSGPMGSCFREDGAIRRCIIGVRFLSGGSGVDF